MQLPTKLPSPDSRRSVQVDKQVHDTASTALSAGLDLGEEPPRLFCLYIELAGANISSVPLPLPPTTAATEQLKRCEGCMAASLADTENRILLITDEQPNSGDYTTEGLASRMRNNAAQNIFTTIIGEEERWVGAWAVLATGCADRTPKMCSPCTFLLNFFHPAFSVRGATPSPLPPSPPQAWAWTSTLSWWRR